MSVNIFNQTYPSYKLRFFYDSDGTPLGLRYIHIMNNAEVIEDYVYIVNPFKEIIGISYYNSSISSLTCSLEAIYIYDAWGNLGKAAQFALSYDSALLGISNSIVNVFWRGKKEW